MLLLTSTSDKIQVVTSAAGSVQVHSSYTDLTGTTVSANRKNTPITTAATTDVVLSPALNVTRNVKALHVANAHASVANTVTLQHTDGTNVIELEKVTLQPGERIAYREGVGMRVITAGGYERTIADSRPTGNANTADVVANAVDTYLAGSSLPVGARMQPGTHFKWRLRVTKTAAGTVAPIFNIRVGTAGAVGDTARNIMTAVAQTAAADVGVIEIDAVVRATGASALMQSSLAFWHTGATSGFWATQIPQLLAVTGTTFDSSVAGNIIGLSVHPGTAGVWTFQTVSVEANNLVP